MIKIRIATICLLALLLCQCRGSSAIRARERQLLPTEGSYLMEDLPASEDTIWDQYPVFTRHMWVNLFCWGGLVDFALLFSRFGKGHPLNLNIHGILMFLIVLPSCYVVLEMKIRDQHPPLMPNHEMEELHEVLGNLFLLLILLQCGLGVVARMSQESSKIIENIRVKNRAHYILGHSLYLLGKLQCGTGIYISFNQTTNAALINTFWAVYFILFFWRVIIELLYSSGEFQQIAYHIKRRFVAEQNQENPDEYLLSYMNSKEVGELEQLHGDKLWVIFKDSILDLTKLTHPGGRQIWLDAKGREVSRFVYGAYPLETTKMPPHTHSKQTLRWIKELQIGKVSVIPLIQRVGENHQARETWRIASNEMVSKTVRQFYFQNGHFTIQAHLSSLSSFGRYILLQSASNQLPARPYSVVMCTTKQSREFRAQLFQYFEQLLEDPKAQRTTKFPQTVDELPVLIKNYSSFNGLSYHVHSQLKDEYFIEGPFGQAFDIPYDSQVVAICGGTGLFPFLDLLEFLYKKTLYLILKETYSEQVAEQINPQGLNFSHSFSLQLILSVSNPSELIGSEVYFELSRLQKQLNRPVFTLIVKSEQEIDQITTFQGRLGRQTLGSILNPHAQRYFVCGPPSFNFDIHNDLRSLGVEPGKIKIV